MGQAKAPPQGRYLGRWDTLAADGAAVPPREASGSAVPSPLVVWLPDAAGTWGGRQTPQPTRHTRGSDDVPDPSRKATTPERLPGHQDLSAGAQAGQMGHPELSLARNSHHPNLAELERRSKQVARYLATTRRGSMGEGDDDDEEEEDDDDEDNGGRIRRMRRRRMKGSEE